MRITCPCLDTSDGEAEIAIVHHYIHALIHVAIEHYKLCPSAVAEALRRTAASTLTPVSLSDLYTALKTTAINHEPLLSNFTEETKH